MRLETDITAPIMKEVDMSYHMKNFNGSFLKVNAFRQDAGPEVDAAWDSLGVNCKNKHHFGGSC